MTPISIAGNKYGKLTAIKRVDSDKYGRARWLFICDCGAEVVAKGSDAKCGHTTSCGCKNAESRLLHSDCRRGGVTRLYHVWQNMMRRCENPRNNSYRYYGARGIAVCPEWHKYGAFKAWSLENGYGDVLEIDRIDNDGNYTPQNCRWVTRIENMHNTSQTVTLVINGESACMTEWARRIKRSPSTLCTWIKKYGEAEATTRVKRLLEVGA